MVTPQNPNPINDSVCILVSARDKKEHVFHIN